MKINVSITLNEVKQLVAEKFTNAGYPCAAGDLDMITLGEYDERSWEGFSLTINDLDLNKQESSFLNSSLQSMKSM